MKDILSYLGMGGFGLILLSVFVEIIPVKINPIQWIGQHLNKSLLNKVENIENKLDNHIVNSYRQDILAFQNECLHNVMHTQEQFRVVLKACSAYNKYIEDNNLENGEIDEATAYIKRVYQKCLDNHDFVDIVNQCVSQNRRKNEES